MKKLILVVSPPACGKTFVSMELSKRLENIVYLDKDTLIPLSKVIFEVAGEEYNRSSDFFEKYIRDKEYEVILDLAYDALKYAELVLINAPFTREIKSKSYIDGLRKKLEEEYNAKLVIIWVETSPETCHQRMIARNSDRDTWKLANWDEYISKVDFNIPEHLLEGKHKDDLLIFHNSSEEEFEQSMKEITPVLHK